MATRIPGRRVAALAAALASLSLASCAQGGGPSDAAGDAGADADAGDDAGTDADAPPDVDAGDAAGDADEDADAGGDDGAPGDAGDAEDGGEEAAPPDRDGDTVPDDEDAFPDDPLESLDTDGDTIGDNADTDDDGDTIGDDEELAFGEDCRISNPLDADTDDDTIADPADPYPRDPWPEFVVNRNDAGSFYFFLSNRDGTFEPRVEGGDDIADNYAAFTIADFDSDGRMDFMGHSETPDADGVRGLYFFYRTARRDEFVQRLVGATGQLVYGTVADVDGDDLMDVVNLQVDRPPGEYIRSVVADTFLNNGTIRTADCVWEDSPSTACAFTRVRAYDLTSLFAGQWVVLQAHQAVDVTGDGIKDLVVASYASGGNAQVPVRVLRGVGDGTFVDPAVIFTHNATGTQAPANSVVFADFTSDGRGDVILGLDDDGDPGQAWIYAGLGGGLFSPTGVVTFDVNPTEESGSDRPGATQSARCFDFDFDGDMDIMVGHSLNMSAPFQSVFEVRPGRGDGQFDDPIQVGPTLPNQFGNEFAIPTRLCPWYEP